MTRAAAPPWTFQLWEDAKGLASAVALTAGFTVVYVAIAPVVLLAALAGGPVWAVIVLVREKATARC